jgi:DNA-3-methyladenine glycosylase I
MEDPYNRCDWGAKTPLTMKYHDERWCKPMHEEQELFAMLSLEIMSSGLSWSLILDKETGMRQAFDQFNPQGLQETWIQVCRPRYCLFIPAVHRDL